VKRRDAVPAALATAAALLSMPNAAKAQPRAVTVYAAGSLRAALTQIGQDFEATPEGGKVEFVFGASGLLRDRLQGGERADVFASANMEHPRALTEAGKAERVQAFARNALCLLAAPGFELKGKTLPQRLLDDDVKLATSTPQADPAGDYAFEMFERVERSGAAPAGSAQRLKAKALQLTGGPNSPPPPRDRNVYGMLIATGQADAFVTYCTNATVAPAGAAVADDRGAGRGQRRRDLRHGDAAAGVGAGAPLRRVRARRGRSAPPRGARLSAARLIDGRQAKRPPSGGLFRCGQRAYLLYAVSPCEVMSRPSRSASSLTRRPIVRSTIL